MNLVYFTQEAYKTLKKDIEQNKDKYYSSDVSWLQEYFEENNIPEFMRTSSVKVGNIDFQYTGDDIESKNADDIQNIISLYSEFKETANIEFKTV